MLSEGQYVDCCAVLGQDPGQRLDGSGRTGLGSNVPAVSIQDDKQVITTGAVFHRVSAHSSVVPVLTQQEVPQLVGGYLESGPIGFTLNPRSKIDLQATGSSTPYSDANR